MDQGEVDGEVQLLDCLLRRRRQRGALVLGMLRSWQMQCLCADLRGWQRGARARRPLLQGEVGVQVLAGSCVDLGLSAWSMWRQMKGAGLRRVLDVAMSDVRRVREGA